MVSATARIGGTADVQFQTDLIEWAFLESQIDGLNEDPACPFRQRNAQISPPFSVANRIFMWDAK
jgi:hypothetical protein